MFFRRIALTSLGLALAASGLGSGPLAASDTDDIVLEPSSKWRLDYAQDKCRLSRAFGPEGEETLLLDQSGSVPFFNLTVIGPRVSKLWGDEAVIRFGPAEEEMTRSYMEGKTPDGSRLVTLFGTTLAPVTKDAEGAVQPIGKARKAAIEYIEIRGRKDKHFVRLNTGSMGEPLEALRKCVVDLEEYLKLDTENGETAPQPSGNPANWITDADYPRSMINRNLGGIILAQMVVDANGNPTACHIEASSRPQTFDDVVCLALLRRAQFTPAHDAEGNPRAAYWSGSVRFQIK